MKFCSNCSKAVPDEAKFCPSCGSVISEKQADYSTGFAVGIDSDINGAPKQEPSQDTAGSNPYGAYTSAGDSSANQSAQWQSAPSMPTPNQISYSSGYNDQPSVNANKTHGLTIAGFIVGIVGICLCWIPFFNVIVSLAGLGLSIAGFIITNKKGYKKPLAIAALIISIVAVVISIIVTICVAVYAVSEISAEFGPHGYYSYHYDFNDIFNA